MRPARRAVATRQHRRHTNRPVRGFVVGFGAVAVAAVLSAIGVTSSAAEPEPPSIVWLATGDSYSSGTGVEGRSGSCRRTDEAYAPRVRQRLEADGWDIRGWAFTACHGATISRRPWEIDPDFNDTVVNAQTLLLEQVEPVISEDGEPPVKADLMTFTFGGNDIHFSRIIRRCAGITLDPLTWWDPRCPYTEKQLRERVDSLEDGNNLTQRGDGIRIWDEDPWPGSLAFFYRQVHERHVAEDGTLIVVGYPRLFAPRQDWTGADRAQCEGISRDDADMLGRVAEHLNEVIARQTTLAAGPRHDIRYVSVRDAFREGIPSFSDGGHELCGTGTPWLTGWQGLFNFEDADFPETTPELIEDEPEDEGSLGARDSYHPNADGHAAMAELLYRELLSLDGTAPTPEPDVPESPSSDTPEGPDDGTAMRDSRLLVANQGWEGISVADIESGERVVLADDGRHARWSPDRSQIAFVRGPAQSSTSEIWIMKADGTDQRLLTEGSSPSWSPDGTQIGFTRVQGPEGEHLSDEWWGSMCGEIRVIGVDGSDERQLRANTFGARLAVAWSPRGDELAFFAGGASTTPGCDGGLSGFYLLGTDGAIRTELVLDGESRPPYAIGWSPDGAKIVAHVARGGASAAIVVVDSDGSHVERLFHPSEAELCTENETCHYNPRYSPDGTRVAYAVRQRDDPWGEVLEIWIAGANGTDRRSVIPESGILWDW